MTISEYTYQKVPKYYPNMYLEGYSPYEIRAAIIRDMIADHVATPEEFEVHISSEVKKK